MTIGKIQFLIYKNFKLGSEYGKQVYNFGFKKRRRRIYFYFFNWVLMIAKKYKFPFKCGKAISVDEFAAMMKKRGVDLSKTEAVEISINGIKPITTEG